MGSCLRVLWLSSLFIRDSTHDNHPPTVTMDETQPLLGLVGEQPSVVVNRPRVDFDPDGDPDNPLEWTRRYKLEVVSLLVIMAFTVYDSFMKAI
jgi:hypothetical protein